MRNNLIKIEVFVLTVLLFCSCEWLLPHKASEDSSQNEEDYSGIDFSDDTMEGVYDGKELGDNDEALVYIDHDPCQMTAYAFYHERYCNNDYSKSERFLSKKLKRALKGISDLEQQTGFIILDSDPFIDAQDVVGSLSNCKFDIGRIGSTDWFMFRYDDVKVRLKVAEEQGQCCIDDVMLPSGQTLTEMYEEEKRNANR